VIHVGRRHQQNLFLAFLKHARKSHAYLVQLFELQRPHSDGHKRKTRIEDLQKGNFYFERVFAAMRHAVFPQSRASRFDLLRKGFIQRRVAQRRPPRPFGENGEIFAHRGMADTQHQDLPGKNDARKHRPRNTAGINVAGVRHEASTDACVWDRRIFSGELSNQAGQFAGISGIKLSGNGRQAQHEPSGIRGASTVCL
jgi:hypothetical protein